MTLLPCCGIFDFQTRVSAIHDYDWHKVKRGVIESIVEERSLLSAWRFVGYHRISTFQPSQQSTLVLRKIPTETSTAIIQ